MVREVDLGGHKIDLGEEFGTEKLGIPDIMNFLVDTVKSQAIYKAAAKFCGEKYAGFFEGDAESIFLAVALGSCVSMMVINVVSMLNPPPPPAPQKKEEPIPEIDITLEQLREFTGADDGSIYVALKGIVYDVTEARDMYGAGSGYNCFAGREASRAMAKLSFDEEDLANHDVSDIGPFEKEVLSGWIEKFSFKYRVVGRVSKPPTDLQMTRSELSHFIGTGAAAKTDVATAGSDSNDQSEAKQAVSAEVAVPPPAGRVNHPIYIAIRKKIIDVSFGGYHMYGPSGGYHLFAGKNVTRALAKMSFTPEDINAGADVDDCSDEQLKTLADWEKKLMDVRKYPVVGTLVD